MELKAWDFDSGNLVLDFANTAEFHASETPDEMLESLEQRHPPVLPAKSS